MESLLQEAGYVEAQISQMTIKEALISLSVAILMGIKPEQIEIYDIVVGEIGGSDNYKEWDPVDIEVARTLLTTIGISSKIKDAKTPKEKADFAALMAIGLPAKHTEITSPITLNDVLGAYQLSLISRGSVN